MAFVIGLSAGECILNVSFCVRRLVMFRWTPAAAYASWCVQRSIRAEGDQGIMI